ncbi:MAG TPA: Rne/Rng family ribonuclease [Longimicrobiales bacterium]|nr:Rne/Rng family ribonuclease [Longimicrobiales bacterium]
MKREILISSTPQEARVAILEDDVLVEFLVERPDAARTVGDIYLGEVQAVLPGIQAAFVDIGTEKAAFLHASDVATDDSDEDDDNGGGNGRRSYPPIQDVVKKGQKMLVQVSKEAISTKGPRVTAQISLPGRFLVHMPQSSHVGVSRKIGDREERSRLRQLAKENMPESGGGLIIRTAGEELTEELFRRELKTLLSSWKQIEKKAKSVKAPALVHREAGLTRGIIRDIFTNKVDSLTVDSPDVHKEIEKYLEGIDPSLMKRVHLYDETLPLFDEYGVEEAIRQAFQRRVDLPSGGYLIIEPTEALVSVDVNTGRYTGKRDPEKTILKTNLDAAREVARQLRLRDIGGIIVVDFIDMETKANQDRLMQELRTYLNRDRARTKAFQVSELGLVEMTRQRVRPSLYYSLTEPCAHCAGAGRVFTPETVIRRIERSLRRAAANGGDRRLAIRVHPQVALHLLEEEPDFMRRNARALELQLEIRDDPLMKADEFRLLEGPAATDVTSKYAV